jgi:hypothetical protein
MNYFTFLNTTNFDTYLQVYDSLAEKLPKHYLDLLIESTFLQIYAALEATLYSECKERSIKKKASLSRFEQALQEQGIHVDNEHWTTLLSIGNVRNCLLHGNGKIDSDQYGQDTTDTINLLNTQANLSLIEINSAPFSSTSSTIKLQPSFLPYFCDTIKKFITMQQ